MNQFNQHIIQKKIAIIFPKDSESVFNNSKRTFGGATVQLYNFAKELCKYHQVSVFINKYENINPSDHQGLNLHFTFHAEDNVLIKVIKFHKTLQQSNPDVIIQRGLTFFSSLLSLYCRFYHIKFIFMFAHDREARGRFQRSNRKNILYSLLLRFADSLVVQNEYQKKAMPVKVRHKVNKIRNGYVITKDSICEKEGILWVGRLEPWKQPELFLDLAEKFPSEPFTLIAPVVKKYESYAQDIYQRAGRIPNMNIIKFVNHREIDRYFKCARLFINTSKEEGFPNTFIQSCKNHTPIVSLSVNPDNFINRYNVGYCCNDSTESLFNYTQKILSDKRLFNTFSQSGYMYAMENHSIEQNVKMLQGLF